MLGRRPAAMARRGSSTRAPAVRAGTTASPSGRLGPRDEPPDHGRDAGDAECLILRDGVERARAKLEYTPLATAFCPQPFTVTDLRQVYEAVWGCELDARNFHRKVTKAEGFLIPTGQTVQRRRGRPAELYVPGPADLLMPPLLRGA